MITQVDLPTKEDLQDLINEALQNGALSSEEFVKNHCAGLINTLEKDPALYRAYGAYWWSVKRILTAQGYDEIVGPDREEITADHFYIEDDVTTLCAAWYYWNFNIESGDMYSSIRIYSYEDDSDFVQFEYSIEDESMEERVLRTSL